MNQKVKIEDVKIIIQSCTKNQRAIVVRKITHVLNISRRQAYDLYKKANRTL